MRRLATLPALVTLGALAVPLPLAHAAIDGHSKERTKGGKAKTIVPSTRYVLPFPCEQTWVGDTRRGHSPSVNSIDFNRPRDERNPVVAAAGGVVAAAYPTSNGGYGRYVVIDHGNSESSLYAHLDSVLVTTGQRIDQGTQLGTVGATGNARGSHLHFEQRVGRTVVPAWFNGAPQVAGAGVSANCADVPVVGNFGGDAAADVAVFRRARVASFIANVGGAAVTTPWGTAVDEPVVGDWDGDGIDDVATRKPKTGVFRLSLPTGNTRIRFGLPTDRPIAGDWDGNGVSEVGVRRASAKVFLLRGADGRITSVSLGDADDLPVTGDWNGDGRTDLGVFDPATALFTLRVVNADGTVSIAQGYFGAAGDLPVAADWDGNGVTELGVWRPSVATFFQGRSTSPMQGRLDVTAVPWGNPR